MDDFSSPLYSLLYTNKATTVDILSSFIWHVHRKALLFVMSNRQWMLHSKKSYIIFREQGWLFWPFRVTIESIGQSCCAKQTSCQHSWQWQACWSSTSRQNSRNYVFFFLRTEVNSTQVNLKNVKIGNSPLFITHTPDFTLQSVFQAQSQLWRLLEQGRM